MRFVTAAEQLSIDCHRARFMLHASTSPLSQPVKRRPASPFLCLAAGLAVLLLGGLQPADASAGNGDQVATFGNWTVLQSRATTPGGARCVAVHRHNGAIQIYNDTLFILLPETPRGYQYRIDANATSSMHLASQTEQQTATVGIAGKVFNELQTGDRFLVEILTYTKVLEVDLDLAGIADAIMFLAKDPACRT
jgi:hypothetical protein